MTENPVKRYTVLKWLAGFLLLVLLIFGAGSLYINIKFRPIITKQLKALVLNATNHLYHIEFSKININFVTGNATLKGLRIVPDTTVFKELIAQKKAPNNLYYIALKKLEIKGFHPINIYKDKKLNIDLVLFDKPDITMKNTQFDFNENKPPRPDRSPYTYISKFLKELSIQTIAFKEIRFKYINNNLQKPEIDSVDHLNITLTDWLIDPTSALDTTRVYLLKDIAVNLDDYCYATPDSLYYIKANQLDFTASTRQLNIKEFSLVPRYTEMQFGKIAGYAKDRYSIEMNNINLNGIELPLYIKKQELVANKMDIADGYVAVFNNNELPKKNIIKIGKDPHQLLQKLGAPLTVKKLQLNNIDFSYTEFDRDSRLSGKVTFEHTSGTVSNITNMPLYKAKNPFMEANLTTYMMGKGKLNVDFKFNLMAKDGAFSYKGTLSGMNGREMNDVTQPLGMVQIKSGDIKKLNFNIDANNAIAKGKVNFTYSDLSIRMLKKEEGRARLVKQGFISLLTNAMVINSSNPKKGVFVSAPINYKRLSTRSFFNFIWKTLFQGIKYSVGVTPKKEASIRKQVARFEKIKADREARRIERQERRKK